MLLLALDTSSAAVTAAVLTGPHLLAERITLDARRHAELLAPSIEAVLAEAQVDRHALTGIAVGVGPGPFTGLRAGIVTARVLGAVLAVPVHGVCSLDGLAMLAVERLALPGGAQFVVTTDARRREVYWARYASVREGGGVIRIAGPGVASPAAVERAAVPVVGRGTALYPEVLGPATEPFESGAGALGAFVARALAAGDPDEVLLAAEPLYLRRPDAAPPGTRKRVLR